MGPQVQQHLESIVCIRWRQRTKYPSLKYFAFHSWELEWPGAWHFMITKANTALDTVSLLLCCISILYEHTNSLRLPGIKFFGMANGWIAWESCSATFCDSLPPVELHQTRWKRPWEDGLAAVLLVVLCIGAISSSTTHVHSLLAVEQILHEMSVDHSVFWSLAFRSRSSCFNCRAGRLDCLSLCDLILLVHMSMRQWTGSCHLQAQRLVFDGWQTVLCSARRICSSDRCLGSLLQILREREEQRGMNQKSAEIKWNKYLYINIYLIFYTIYKPTQTVINLWTGKDGWTRGAHSLFLSLSIAGSISLSTGCWLRVETHWVAQAAANASVAFP